MNSKKKLKSIVDDIPERDNTSDKTYFNNGEKEHIIISDEQPSIVPNQYCVMNDAPPKSMNHSVCCRIIH